MYGIIQNGILEGKLHGEYCGAQNAIYDSKIDPRKVRRLMKCWGVCCTRVDYKTAMPYPFSKKYFSNTAKDLIFRDWLYNQTKDTGFPSSRE
ncbi:MAG: hypothetical protein HZC17_09685 [Candidatus Omnitrophica bacterium]|nr:hypothetical protein [Candidatus Omnitrophota bacterium]